MELLLFWGAVLLPLTLAPLMVVWIAWSPFAAFLLYRKMSRRGYRSVRYAGLGALYSVLFFVPWVLAMLEDWKPNETGVFSKIMFALLYLLWAGLIASGFVYAGFDSDPAEGYWFYTYVKVWLPFSGVAGLGSLWWLTLDRPHTQDDRGLPGPYQVLPFALFTLSLVSLTAPLYIDGLRD